MGVYIPNMEMPKSCIACLLNFGEKRPEYGLTICCPYSGGVIAWRDKAFDNGRLASCGIVPVPSHGRLIDADARVNVQIYNDEFEDFQTVNMSIDDLLDSSWIEFEDAPTIIQAEPGEEETT